MRVRIVRIEHHREAEVGRQAVRDARPALTGVAWTVDATVELHEEALGPRRSPVHVVDAERRSCPRDSSGM